MSDVQLFRNSPLFCQKQLSTQEVLNLQTLNAAWEGNPETSSFARCGDPNLGVLMVKNLYHKAIRCGGKPIDVNFLMDMFPQMGSPNMVSTKTWYNHYICDTNLNIYAANNVTGTAPGAPAWITLLKANHGGQGGVYSLPAKGYQIMDKENQIQYTVTDVDNSVPYAHRFELTPNDETVTVDIKANKAYLVLQSRLVGGCQCPEITNDLSSIGYTQQVHPIRVRKDWKLCVDLLTGYENKFQFAVIYDLQGNPMDAWDLYEKQKMREDLRLTLNVLSFIGTPTTNPALISGMDATIDSNHTGFYGFLPTLKYGGGNVYNFRSDLGFDLEADGEPILLYQDSRKRTKNFTVLAGAKFMMSLVDRTNKLVARQMVGSNMWEAYKRLGDVTGNDYATEIAKLGIDGYKYQGFNLDFKKMDSWSDYRFIGNDDFSSMAIFMPQDGISENGRPLQPVEFYTYGQGQWTGQYEEHYIDYRNTNGCNDIGGWAAESLAMAVHCPDQFILANPVKAA